MKDMPIWFFDHTDSRLEVPFEFPYTDRMKDKEEEFIAFISDYLKDLENEYSCGSNDKAYIQFNLVDQIQEVFHNKYSEIVLGLPPEEA